MLQNNIAGKQSRKSLKIGFRSTSVSILDLLAEQRQLLQELLGVVERRRAVDDSLCRV